MGRHSEQRQDRPQYQLVSPGTPTDPRAMSQVSPGFIFVNFLCLCDAFGCHALSQDFLVQFASSFPFFLTLVVFLASFTSFGIRCRGLTLNQNNKDQLIQSLRTHRVNTITELRRIEKIFAYLDSAEVTEPMTSAWAHYVNSNNLLNELRGLTKTCPFSSECLDEAKQLVVRDPHSVRSWNYCWLVLVKMEKE